MIAASILMLFGWMLAAEVQIVCPQYPALAIRGGNVVAMLEIAAGAVREVRILHGDSPFVEPSRTALRQWRFPAARGDVPVLVVVNFRDPYLTMTKTKDGILLGPQERVIKAEQPPRGLPCPTLVVDPFYPGATMIVMGASVLRFTVTAVGSVENTEVLRELGDLTPSTLEAVRKWKFLPALDKEGKPIVSDAFAVCVYRPLETSRETR